MILNSDLILYFPLWEKTDSELCNPESIGLFRRLVDIFLIACSIGIKEDKTIVDIKDPLEQPKTIGRNTYMSQTNNDLSSILEFLLQNAIINSKTINYDIDERLKLAFDPDYYNSKLSAASFLIGFANFGIAKIYEMIDSKNDLIIIDNLYRYFSDMLESDYDEILKTITLEE